MPHPNSFEDMQFNLIGRRPAATERPEAETPFRIAVLGDFSGRSNRRLTESMATRSNLRPIAVDCDNLDRVLAKLGVALNLPVVGSDDHHVQVKFSDLDDFHPDQIYHRLDLFQALKKTRRDLLNPTTFDAAAAEVRSWAQPSSHAGQNKGQVTQPAEVAGDGPSSDQTDPFAQLLGKPAALPEAAPHRRTSAAVQTLLEQVVGPYVVPSTDPQQEQLIEAVDAATSKQMRAILHHPEFVALEAAWRGLDFLVRHLETDELLKLYLLDVSKEELADDLASSGDLASTGTYKLLVEQTVGTAGGQPWAVVVGDYTFDATEQDMRALGCIASIAAHAGAPFLAAASPHLVECESMGKVADRANWNQPIDPKVKQIWDAVRHLSQATYVGLVLPGFLLRLPYGANTDSIDSFNFEEIEGDPSQGPHLWGNGAFVGAYLLGQEYSQQGWSFTPGAGLDIEDLPTHTYKQDGESKMTPCGQAWLSDVVAETILERGIMPLLSIRGRDAVRLARFESIADPAKNLAGRWG